MPKKPIKILAINPGSKYLGIAFFQGSELRDWRIRVIKGRWSKEKVKKIKTIVFNFIERFEPNILTIKRLHPSRSSPNLNRLVTKIRQLGRRKGIRKVCEYSIEDLENLLSTGEKIRNKGQLAEIVASHYPFLFNELEKERRNKNRYFTRMFEAIALGIACFSELDH